MGKRRTTKSLTKRIRITRTGKVIRRQIGVDHFRTRKPQRLLRKKGKTVGLGLPMKTILNY